MGTVLQKQGRDRMQTKVLNTQSRAIYRAITIGECRRCLLASLIARDRIETFQRSKTRENAITYIDETKEYCPAVNLQSSLPWNA